MLNNKAEKNLGVVFENAKTSFIQPRMISKIKGSFTPTTVKINNKIVALVNS